MIYDNFASDFQFNLYFCTDSTFKNEENRVMSMRMGIGWLWVTTFVISLLSNVVVETIDGFAKKSSMSQIFVSLQLGCLLIVAYH